MNHVEIFKNPEFGSIRVVEIGGEPWLVGKDVALALGYKNPQEAIRDHVDTEDKGVSEILTPGGRQKLPVINESGLYSLVLSSKLPKAKQFRRWVTSEVLPSIRKYGAYMTKEKLWEVATSPEALLKLCTDLLAEREENATLREENARLAGKAAFYDLFIDLKHSTNLRTTAKELVVPERQFVRFLLEQRFVYRTASGNVLPYAKPSNDGLFCVKDFCNHGHIGSYRVNKTRDFTVMGNTHLRDKNLSLKAVGLLSKMLSFNDGWQFSTRGLAALCKEGPDAILSALKELEENGYLVRHRGRDDKGRMVSTEFDIYEMPQAGLPHRDNPHRENPDVENPDVENPHRENPAQRNTIQVITQERNTLSKNYQSINLDGMDRMDERSEYEEIIKENLDYNILCQDPKFDKDRFREIMDIMLDAVCSTAPTIRINGEDMPQQVVKSRFLKLNSSHIEYVLEAMNKNPSDIRNIRAYLLTALYNASLTIDNYYSALVNHDFYGQDRSAGSKKSKTYDYSLCEDTL